MVVVMVAVGVVPFIQGRGLRADEDGAGTVGRRSDTLQLAM